MYIRVVDFKDLFYPAREMSKDYNTTKKDRLRQAYMKKGNRDSDDDDEDIPDDAS